MAKLSIRVPVAYSYNCRWSNRIRQTFSGYPVHSAIVNIHINGENREIPAGQCVSTLLVWLDLTSDRVAVELNKSLVRKRDWANAAIMEGDRIEIVEFVGGG